MRFQEIVIAGAATYTNTSASFLLLISWANSFTIKDQSGTAVSGTIASYTATNSLVLIPPSWQITAGASQVNIQALSVTFEELVSAVVGSE